MGIFKKSENKAPETSSTKETTTMTKEAVAKKEEAVDQVQKTAQEVVSAMGNEVKAADDSLPAYMQGYDGPMGSENIDNADITIPRLKVAQAIQDEVKDGLIKEGALYINVTGESLWEPGDDPLMVLFVGITKEYILWRPREDGGGILARAQPVRDGGITRYKWDNPNEKFEVKVGGKIKTTWETKSFIDEDGLGEWGSELPDQDDSGPAATAHHNYLLFVPSAHVVCAVSLSRSGVKVAKNLNAAIKMGDASKLPLAVRKFQITTIEEVNDNGDKYKNWKFKPHGMLTGSPEDMAIATESLAYAKQFREGGFTVEQSDDKPGEGAAGGGGGRPARSGGNDKMDDDIPF